MTDLGNGVLLKIDANYTTIAFNMKIDVSYITIAFDDNNRIYKWGSLLEPEYLPTMACEQFERLYCNEFSSEEEKKDAERAICALERYIDLKEKAKLKLKKEVKSKDLGKIEVRRNFNDGIYK